MRLVSLKQGTPLWKAYRRKMIMASDAPSLLGVSPYKSILELYEEKVFGFEQEMNPFMKRGAELESLALECFEKETGLTLFPVVVEHDSIPWMAASLDGMTIARDALVEIKCNGKKNHELALNGKVPKHFFTQIQHQLACTDLKFAYYFSYTGTQGTIIEVKRDQEFIEEMLEKEREFWHCLQTFTPPRIENKTNSRSKKKVLI